VSYPTAGRRIEVEGVTKGAADVAKARANDKALVAAAEVSDDASGSSEEER